MVLRDRQHKWLFPKNLHEYVGFDDWGRRQHEVELPIEKGPHKICLKIFANIDLDIWKLLPATADQRGEKVGSHRGNGPHGDFSLKRSAVSKFLGCVLDFE